jgi:hypothetical protein
VLVNASAANDVVQVRCLRCSRRTRHGMKAMERWVERGNARERWVERERARGLLWVGWCPMPSRLARPRAPASSWSPARRRSTSCTGARTWWFRCSRRFSFMFKPCAPGCRPCCASTLPTMSRGSSSSPPTGLTSSSSSTPT